MKFALVNGQRQEAQPSLSGRCLNPDCDRPMVAKCGEVRSWHWAHQGRRCSDPWWENETDWHRAWKDRFPHNWQEVVHRAETGEKHIADVKTDRGWAIEFQHSYLKPEERRSRDAFYPKLIWIVDGTRRKTDAEKFTAAWQESMPVGNSSFVRRLRADECALVRDWADIHGHTFLDFGEMHGLWWLAPGCSTGSAYVARFLHADFVTIHCDATQKDLFDDLSKKFSELVAGQEALRQAQAMKRPFPQPLYGNSPFAFANRRRRRF